MHRHPDWTDTVRRHWHRTAGFLLASRQPCIRIRDEELAAVGGNRNLASRAPNDLKDWAPPGSWVLGVLLCPSDAVEPIIQWLRTQRADPSRVWFFLHTRTDWEVLRPWKDAGYDTDQADIVEDWKQLHKLWGLVLNDRVYADWRHLGEG